MIIENFDLIEYRGFKDIFIGLYKEKDKDEKGYYIIYGKTGLPSLSLEENNQRVYFKFSEIASFVSSKNVVLQVPFIDNKNSYFSIVYIKDRSTYDTLVTVLEALL